MTRRARVRLGRRDDDSTGRPRRDAIERSHDAVRRSRPVDASGERARVSPRSLESSMDGRRPPRDRASRARVVGRPTASSRERDDAASRPRETRARRAASARDARVARGKRERERRDGARERRARTRVRVRDVARREFFCARRVTQPRRRATTRGDGHAARTRECECVILSSIAIVRRARRCASPPRARL